MKSTNLPLKSDFANLNSVSRKNRTSSLRLFLRLWRHLNFGRHAGQWFLLEFRRLYLQQSIQ